MNIATAHRYFRFGMDKEASLNYPNYLPEEIDLLLNQAQERVIKQRYGNNNIKRDSFEQTEKRIEDLKAIIETATLTPDNFFGTSIPSKENISSTTRTFNIGDIGHWFTIWDKAIINCPTCNDQVRLYTNNYGDIPTSILIDGTETEIRSITHLELEKVKKDPFKGPDNTKSLKLMYKNRVELIVKQGCTPLYYIMRYIKKPTPVSLSGNITFILSEHIHSEIVDEAIKIALEGIEAKRNNTFTPIVDNNKE